MSETLFIAEAVRRAGCGLLLDINNVFVSAANHGFAALDYLADFPLEHVGEVHLAGHAQQADDEGELLLIDSHDRPVADAVWKLFDVVISQCGFDQADNLFVLFSCTRSLFLEPRLTERELSSKFSAAMANVVHRIAWRLARGNSI
jgi:hypothetical protein